jgi:hypothetical protein
VKRSEIIAGLREIQVASANARGWLDSVDEKVAALIERLAAPPVEQPAPEPSPQEPPASDFTVQPADGRDDYTPASKRGTVQFEGDPVAKSVATLVTPKQLGMIRALAREAGVDYEVECEAQLKCKADELSKRAASAFIDYLKNLQAEGGADFRRAS